jgi:gliding motility-associated-like protein
MRFFNIALFISLVCHETHAQLQNHNWLSGSSTFGILFDNTTNVPSVFSGKYPTTGVCGATVISNPIDGTLLFYSDGLLIVDKNHQVMPNGSGLISSAGTNQPSAVCAYPGECGKYYLFTNNGDASSNPNSGSIYYSIVDMNLAGNTTLANPSGDIISGKKNIFLDNGSTEGMTIAPHANYRTSFLLIPKVNSDLIRIYKVDQTGVTLNSDFHTGITFSYTSLIKYNAQTKKIVILSYVENYPILLADFNDNTGQLSNVFIMPGTPFGNDNTIYAGIHSAEWSPDNMKLYISKYRMYSPVSGGKIFQFDMNNPSNPPVLIITFSNSDPDATGLGLKLGPDGKLYFLYNTTAFKDNRLIGVISNPNNAGVACNPNLNGFNFGIHSGFTQLFPDFLYYQNQKPLANNDFFTSSCIAGPSDLNVLLNDSDPDSDFLKVSILSVKQGSANTTSANNINYTPPVSGISGNDTIFYAISDQDCFLPMLDSAYAIVCLDLIPCNNQAPIALKDIVVPCINICDRININVLANDSDPDNDPLSLSVIKTAHGSGTVLSNNTIDYTPNTTYVGVDTIQYLLCDSSCNSSCVLGSAFICIEDIKLLIPNLFTPDGDTLNDQFTIKGICDHIYLEIYNRWGSLIYESENYKHDWSGKGQNDGVYYYYIRDLDRNKEYKGWIEILR